MGDPLSLKWNGVEAVLEVLKVVPEKYIRSELLNATKRAATVILRAMKANYSAKTRTGLLLKSLGTKVDRRANGNVVARIGPRRGFRSLVVLQPRGAYGMRLARKNKQDVIATNKKGNALALVKLRKGSERLAGQIVSPTRYAHLVEKGHGGKHAAKGRPFMQPAVESTKTQVAEIIADGIRRAIAKAQK